MMAKDEVVGRKFLMVYKSVEVVTWETTNKLFNQLQLAKEFSCPLFMVLQKKFLFILVLECLHATLSSTVMYLL